MGSNYPKAGARSRLKVAHLPNKPPPRLKLGGMLPSEKMPAGEYTVTCTAAAMKRWSKGWRIELKHRVIDGEHTGVTLNQWIITDISGEISPASRYAKQCEIALGRPPDAEDDLNDPGSIFCGRHYKAFAGFRKTDKPNGGSNVNAEKNKLVKKDDFDGLRVHDLLSRVEL